MVNVGGRPRTHNREQIAIDIIEWAKKDDSINLNKFCAHYDPIIPPSMLGIWAREDEGFRRSYESAKAFIAYRREERLSSEQLHVKAYDLNATNYDVLLRESKQQDQAYEASLKSKEEKQVTEMQKEQHQSLLTSIESLKKVYSDSARNIEDNRRSKESMS